MGDFFEETFGFEEAGDYEDTQQALQNIATFRRVTALDGVKQPFFAEECTFNTEHRGPVSAGIAYTPSVAELHAQLAAVLAGCTAEEKENIAAMKTALANEEKPFTIKNIVGESRSLHGEARCVGATVQAASQFNLLEFPGPTTVPEKGITGYLYDRTQGPACAIACAAGTAYRNYLMPTPVLAETTTRGQTRNNQINCMQEVEAEVISELKPEDRFFWRTKNGYVESTPEKLQEFNDKYKSLSEERRDEITSLLRIGVQQDTHVTDTKSVKDPGTGKWVWRPLTASDGKPVSVTQTYNAAISVGYSRCNANSWRSVAQLVLDGTYEATLLVAALQAVRAAKTGATTTPTVFLTKVGGGVFANDMHWINAAMARAVERVPMKHGVPLDIKIVHYASVESGYDNLERL